MKKSLCMMLALCIATMLMGCNSLNNKVYIPENRVVLSRSLDGSRLEPNFDYNLLWSEVIVEATITTDGVENVRPISEGFEEIPMEERPQIAYTSYEASVLNVWQGELTTDTFTLHILGNLDTAVTKPLKDDQLVLFLKYDADNNAYCLVDYEYSMFAVNSGSTMYAFGDLDSFTCYDNKPVESFKAAIQEKYNCIDEIYNNANLPPQVIRSIARDYLEEKGVTVD